MGKQMHGSRVLVPPKCDGEVMPRRLEILETTVFVNFRVDSETELLEWTKYYEDNAALEVICDERFSVRGGVVEMEFDVEALKLSAIVTVCGDLVML